MSPGLKFFTAWYGSAIIWDLRCGPGQTVSEAVAALIAGRYTRWPATAVILATVAHLFALARTAGSPANDR